MIRTAVLFLAVVTLSSCASLRNALRDDPPPPKKEKDSGFDFGGALLDGLAADDSGFGFVARSLKSVDHANERLTPQQEYYLGRAFGAQILASRKALRNEAANRYVNELGQALALFSERPETWSGYRFLILDSDEVNAFAAPGGFIFVSKGLLKLTRNEAELAAVLAHEIAHVEREHGLNAVRKDRLAKAAVGIGADAAQTFGSSDIKELSAAFEDSVADLTSAIVNKGYSRETEFEADAAALGLLSRAGFPPQALVTMLEALKNLPKSGEGGFSKTHPTPEQRIAEAKRQLGKYKDYGVSSTQKRRFAALGGL